MLSEVAISSYLLWLSILASSSTFQLPIARTCLRFITSSLGENTNPTLEPTPPPPNCQPIEEPPIGPPFPARYHNDAPSNFIPTTPPRSSSSDEAGVQTTEGDRKNENEEDTDIEASDVDGNGCQGAKRVTVSEPVKSRIGIVAGEPEKSVTLLSWPHQKFAVMAPVTLESIDGESMLLLSTRRLCML